MSFWQGEFSTGNSVQTRDSFLSLPGWHKGLAWINGFNLGRYWPVVGPQKTLYVPGSLLRPQPAFNKIVILEQDHPPCFTGPVCQVEFVDIPDIDGDTPEQKIFVQKMTNGLQYIMKLFIQFGAVV